ncbi:MAG: enoyl-CoA hydratase/isomerase family protein [Frankiaceae bacterium]|nr:enoyl-CoA hydratase/isomerase family protein [Frankiaceae bacterium]
MSALTINIADGIAELVLSRPQALNAISTDLATELASATAELRGNDVVRVVLLAAEGDRAFCVGADLKERNGMSDADLLAQRVVFRAAFGGVLHLPQPTVAAVHGFALGGGCELALSCDLVVADESAVLGLPEVSIGLVPGGGGTQLALRRLGPGRAADVVLTGRRIAAGEAHALGLVDRLVPAGSARNAAREVAAQIAKNSPVATRAAKRALRHGWGLDYAAAMDVEDAAWRTAATSADRREGIAAFNEKRPPVWPGR